MEDYQITSFSAGELTPRGRGRIDSESYAKGCETLLNAIVLPQGGVTRKPGSIKKDTLLAGTRLIEFEGKDGIGYVLALNDLELRVYSEGVMLTGFGTAGVITTTWTLSMIWDISIAMDGDIMYMFHREIRGQELLYTPGTPSFALSNWLGIIGTEAKKTWNAQNFDTSDNYPGACTMYEGRLLVASSNNWPEHMWGSRVKSNDDFEETLAGLLATDSFEVKINSEKGPLIKWIRGARGVFVGSSKGVFSVSDKDNLLSPVTLITAKINSSYPAKSIPGIFIGGELFYIQEGGRKVRLAAYNAEQDVYITPDVTTASEHITEGIIKSIVVQTIPETLVWAVLEDGVLISYSMSQENQVSAWTRHSTEGLYKDIVIVNENGLEVIYVLVDRGGIEYLEVMSPIAFDNKNYHFLDSAVIQEFGSVIDVTSIVWGSTQITVNKTSHGLSTGDFIIVNDTDNDDLDYSIFKVGSALTNSFELLDEVTGQMAVMDDFGTINTGNVQLVDDTITGLTHLEGDEVFVMSGPVPVGAYTVSGGEITLTHKRTKFSAGYNYFTDISPMNIAIGKNKKKRVIALAIEILNTLGGKSGKDADNLDEFASFYDKTIVMDNPQDLISGTVRIPHRGGYSFEGKILIRQDLPLPLTVLSLTVEVEVE